MKAVGPAANVVIMLMVGVLAGGCVKTDTYRVGIPASYAPSALSVHVSVMEEVQPRGHPRVGLMTVKFFQNDRLAPDIAVSYVGEGGTQFVLGWRHDPDNPSRGYGNVSDRPLVLTGRSLRFVYRYGPTGRQSKRFAVSVPTAGEIRPTGPVSRSSGGATRLRLECHGRCLSHSTVSYTLSSGRDSYHSHPATRVEGAAVVAGSATYGGSQPEVGYYDLPWPSNLTTTGRYTGEVRLTRVLPARTQAAQGFRSITRDEWRLTTVCGADWHKFAG